LLIRKLFLVLPYNSIPEYAINYSNHFKITAGNNRVATSFRYAAPIIYLAGFYIMKPTTYQRKLSHPDWQRKRLEILNRDNFTCQYCDVKDKELHIHHIYYMPNTLPQDYPDSAYITLCHDCHAYEGDALQCLGKNIMNLLRTKGANSFEISDLMSAISESSEKIQTIAKIISSLDDIVGIKYKSSTEKSL